jgi:hypothetical protein
MYIVSQVLEKFSRENLFVLTKVNASLLHKARQLALKKVILRGKIIFECNT